MRRLLAAGAVALALTLPSGALASPSDDLNGYIKSQQCAADVYAMVAGVHDVQDVGLYNEAAAALAGRCQDPLIPIPAYSPYYRAAQLQWSANAAGSEGESLWAQYLNSGKTDKAASDESFKKQWLSNDLTTQAGDAAYSAANRPAGY
jgi:hypothetical protein